MVRHPGIIRQHKTDQTPVIIHSVFFLDTNKVLWTHQLHCLTHKIREKRWNDPNKVFRLRYLQLSISTISLAQIFKLNFALAGDQGVTIVCPSECLEHSISIFRRSQYFVLLQLMKKSVRKLMRLMQVCERWNSAHPRLCPAFPFKLVTAPGSSQSCYHSLRES